MRRGPLLAVLLCLAGGFLVLVGTGRAWVLVGVAGSALLPARDVAVTGADLAPGLRALGLVGLAGVPALAASRGRGRLLVGLVLLLAGGAAVAVVAGLELGRLGIGERALVSQPVREAGGAEAGTSALTVWPVTTALGGLVLALAGLLVLVRGPRWAALGRRYEAPAVRQPAPASTGPVAERELWEALDRGDDPTAAGPVDPGASEPGARG